MIQTNILYFSVPEIPNSRISKAVESQGISEISRIKKIEF